MPESVVHRELADRIVSYVSECFAHVPAFIVLSDRPGASVELPPRIGGFVPDVFAADVPTTFTVVGEAKTEEDLTTERSCRQVTAFLRFLASSPNGLFILAVPWRASAAARALLASGTSGLARGAVEVVLLDGVAWPTPRTAGAQC